MRQILAIHRHGSFIKAAEELGVAQPTLSKSIARLEDELRVMLFDRSGKRTRVTPMGALVVERATELIANANRLERDVGLMADGAFGEARIGLGPGLRPVFAPRFAEAIATRFPKLRLTMMIEHRQHLMEGLRTGEFDIVILVAADELDRLDVVQVEVMRDPFIAVARPDHPLAGRSKIAADEFLRHPVASAGTAFSLAELMGLDDAPSMPPAHFVSNDYGMIKALIRAGLVSCVGSEHVFHDEIAAGEIVRLDIDWVHEIRLVAVMTRAANHSPILQAIVAEAVRLGEVTASLR
jgi:DNA-binding transcriptional LysR family regulator